MSGKSRARANGEGSIYPAPQRLRRVRLGHNPGRQAQAQVRLRAGPRDRPPQVDRAAHAASQRPVATSPDPRRVPRLLAAEVIEPNRAPLTAPTYESLVRLYLVPGLGGKRLDRLSVRDVQRGSTAFASLPVLRSGQGRQPPGEPAAMLRGREVLPAGSFGPDVRDLRTVLAVGAVDRHARGADHSNVAALVTVPAGAQAARRGLVNEARTFLESARADGDPLYALYVLVLVLGLRKGEALGLAWEDVDLDGGELAICWQVQRVGRELLRRETKTEASDATLPLPALCVTALQLRAEQQSETRTRPA